MIKKTYRSKKYKAGALDHRDMLQNVNEKSSIFDAYYIQNIKQTKRDLSSVGASSNYGVASKKVRKRKYVKRIVKEIEPVAEDQTLSPCAYLTPDKSIRVNKAYDPFDMLLMSSPALAPAQEKNSIELVTKNVNVGKTYARKKLTRQRKLNYSSSDSCESDKENATINPSNTTDIRTHKLLVERAPSNSPKCVDDSINKIVNNLSLINYKKKTNGSFNTSFKFTKNRLTRNLNSPILQKSPLCSTPFKDKYRGKSIYNFSPITSKEDSPNYVTITEENDEINTSIVLQSSKLGHSKLTKVTNNTTPITNISKNIRLREDLQNTVINNVSNDSLNVEDGDVIPEIEEETEKSTTELTTLQTTEVEPFLGFNTEQNLNPDNIYNEDDNKSTNDNSSQDTSYNANDNNDTSDVKLSSNEDSRRNSPNNSEEIENASDDSSESSVDSDKESMYDTCNSEQSSTTDEIDVNTKAKDPIVAIERMSDSVFLKYYEKMQYESDDQNNTDDDYASVSNKSQSNTSDISLSTDPEVIENKPIEIVITDSSTTEDVASSNDDNHSNSDEEKCISFVTTRRRNDFTNDSMFIFDNSYGSSSTDCDKTVLSNKIRKSIVDVEIGTHNDSIEVINEVNDPVLTNDNDECNETSRITVRKSRVTKHETEIGINETTLIEIPEESNKATVNVDQTSDIHKSPVIPTVSTREKSQLFRNSSFMRDPRESSRYDTDAKPNIVLKPGKKWERSLSIYKRMTMMNDSLDKSILDENSQNKGRKYRQSVISTMEMQDSLHNESLNSRRSTFVSKPGRPIVRFVIDPDNSRVSLNSSTVYDDLKLLKGFLHEECDDTVIELSKLSLVDSEHEVTVLETVHDSDRLNTARDYVLRRCNQTEPILFDECYPEPLLKNCHKIGEGVYGEVFLWRGRDARARVMKIVPIAGQVKVNGEVQKDFHEIISEIVIAMELSALRAPIAEIDRLLNEGKDIDSLDLHAIENATDVFNEVLAVRCVYGQYPSRLLDLWDLYDECKGSENDNPATLPVDQQYIVLELANAGQDLESYQFANAQQAHALFLQIAFGLAVAEEAFQFEHRDLHWGNVLISQTEQEFATFVVRHRVFRVRRCGVAGAVIDYSLSRAALGAALLYNDLSHDDQLFDALGDYQFQVYRLMRDKLGNDWKNFEPYTNILWLHYTVDKMITALRYKRTNTKIHKQYIERLKGIQGRLLEYGSATLYVLTDPDV